MPAKNDGRITPKAHAHLQTITKTTEKFQKLWYKTLWYKTVREAAPTNYPCHRVTTKET